MTPHEQRLCAMLQAVPPHLLVRANQTFEGFEQAVRFIADPYHVAIAGVPLGAKPKSYVVAVDLVVAGVGVTEAEAWENAFHRRLLWAINRKAAIGFFDGNRVADVIEKLGQKEPQQGWAARLLLLQESL